MMKCRYQNEILIEELYFYFMDALSVRVLNFAPGSIQREWKNKTKHIHENKEPVWLRNLMTFDIKKKKHPHEPK